MKTKCKFLIKQSLNKKINTKSFKIVNVLLCLLLIGLSNMDRIVAFFGGDFANEVTIVVKDDVGVAQSFKTLFEENVKLLQDSKSFKIEEADETLDKEIEEMNLEENREKRIVLHIENDDANYLKVNIISYDENSTVTNQMIISTLNTIKYNMAAVANGITPEILDSLSTPIETKITLTNEEAQNQNGKDVISAIVTLVIIMPCFFLIVYLVQMIGAEVNDEKTSRGMEIIISNVSPKVHFLSKIIAGTSFVLIQSVLIFLYGVIAILIRQALGGNDAIMSLDAVSKAGSLLETVKSSGVIETLLQGLPWIILLLVVSFLAYAILAGVLASVTTSNEDFQQLQTPLMLAIMAGYYLAIIAVGFEGAVFIKVASYIPMLSFMLSPVLFMLGQITIWELAISTLIMIVFTGIIFKYGLRIYKVGILNYSSSNLWKKMFESIKQK
ncbi:MAG: ABC transporter permease [Bacilli bacterium]|nr:ABC transporter permease [Bacilli bacterium]